jgi:hypothetical protein
MPLVPFLLVGSVMLLALLLALARLARASPDNVHAGVERERAGV